METRVLVVGYQLDTPVETAFPPAPSARENAGPTSSSGAAVEPPPAPESGAADAAVDAS